MFTVSAAEPCVSDCSRFRSGSLPTTRQQRMVSHHRQPRPALRWGRRISVGKAEGTLRERGAVTERILMLRVVVEGKPAFHRVPPSSLRNRTKHILVMILSSYTPVFVIDVRPEVNVTVGIMPRAVDEGTPEVAKGRVGLMSGEADCAPSPNGLLSTAP